MPVTASVAPSLRRRRRRRRGPSRLRRNGPRARRTRATSGDGGRSSSGPRAATTTAPSSSATRSSCTARPVSRASTQPTATPRACKCCTTTLRPSRRAWTATSARSMRRPSCVGDTVHNVGCRDSGRLCDPVPCARVARAASTRRCAGARRWCRQRTWCPRAAGRWRRATRVPGRTVTANVRRKHPPLIASKALWRALLRRCSGFFGSCREQRAE